MKIEKCPFCGKEVAEISNCNELEECRHFEKCPTTEPYVCVVCSMFKGGCGASSGYYDSAEKAIAAWNRRADTVPVVRCGECANAKCIDKNESVYTCTHPQWTRKPHKDTFEESQLFHGLEGNDFCSYGAKMESEGST